MFKILPLMLVPRESADVNFISLNLLSGLAEGHHWLPSARDPFQLGHQGLEFRICLFLVLIAVEQERFPSELPF